MESIGRVMGNIRNSFRRPDFQPTYVSPKSSRSTRSLMVLNVDYSIALNGINHKTETYNLMLKEKNPSLVVRRGQCFKIDITFNRAFDSDSDLISLIFSMEDNGREPTIPRKTLYPLPLLIGETEVDDLWKLKFLEQKETVLSIEVYTSPASYIGIWHLEIDTKLKEGGELTYWHRVPIYIIFNPWCLEDQVFMNNEDARFEYVDQHYGFIYKDEENPLLWRYCQHERDILDCVIYLLTKVGNIHTNLRGDPIAISRLLTSVVNGEDNNGILKACWDDDNQEGISQTTWQGSMPIIQRYYKTKQIIKCNQCWVFAGVLTTLCRAIGLPCRPVTNYQSAVDLNGSMIMEVNLERDGKEYGDQIWNFHVWNEVWMKRPDLGERYSGWQVIDSTPLQRFRGIYKCGPASVIAIRDGNIMQPYDTQFISGALNSKVVVLKKNGGDNRPTLLKIEDDRIGIEILTKSVDGDDVEDLTRSYKHQEDSDEYRANSTRIIKTIQKLSEYYKPNPMVEDVRFELLVVRNCVIGQNLTLTVIIINNSRTIEHKVEGAVRIAAIDYRGRTLKQVYGKGFNSPVLPGCSENVNIVIPFKNYYDPKTDEFNYKAVCTATVMGNAYEFYQSKRFYLSKPDISAIVNGSTEVGKPVEVMFKVENVLPFPLTNGEFQIEAFTPAVAKSQKVKSPVLSGSFAVATFHITPPRIGRHTIAVIFKSKELSGVHGHYQLRL